MQLSDRIGRRMKLHDLHVLMAVVQAGSMSRAAQILHTTQPAISRSVAELEHAVGVQLLHRSRQGVEPTEYGRALVHGGAAMLDELRQAVKKIELLADPGAGSVRIGTTPPLAASFVSAVIDRLSSRYPRVVFHVVTGGSEPLRRELLDRNIDVLIFRQTGSVVDGRVIFTPLFDSPYVVAAGEKSPWTGRRRIALAELKHETWVLPPPDHTFGKFVVEAFQAAGLDFPHTTVVASGLELVSNLLRTGRYLTVLPQFWLQFPERHPFIKRLPAKLPIPSAPVGVITLKGRAPTPVVQRFIDCARAVAKPLARCGSSPCSAS